MTGRAWWVSFFTAAAFSGALARGQPPAGVDLAPSSGQVRRLPPVEPEFAGPELPDPLSGIPAPPAPEPAPKLWEGSFELGLNGTEGNSRTFNFRFGLDAKRKTPRDVFSVDLDYHKNTSRSVETANRAYLDWRYEWLIEDSLWTLFVHGTDDYDEFRPYDIRVTIDAGVGRKLIDTDWTSLLGRLGAGVSRELGGTNEQYVPELGFGLDLNHKISKRQKLAATIDYRPEVANFSDCRINARLSWVVVLDEEANLSLKVSLLDRYDSTPDSGEPNDVDYSTVLLWSF